MPDLPKLTPSQQVQRNIAELYTHAWLRDAKQAAPMADPFNKKKKIKIHQIVITVLTEEDEGVDLKGCDLDLIRYQITQGDYVGQVEYVSERILQPDEVVPALLKLANDGTFFDI